MEYKKRIVKKWFIPTADWRPSTYSTTVLHPSEMVFFVLTSKSDDIDDDDDGGGVSEVKVEGDGLISSG